MTFQRLLVAASVAALATACGDDSSTVQSYVAEVDQSLAAVEADMDQHHASVLATSDMSMVQTLEQTHLQRVQPDMMRMHDAESSLMVCSSAMLNMHHAERSELAAQSSGFSELWLSMRDEMTRHHDAMLAARNLNDAWIEERAYRDTMHGRLIHLSVHRDLMLDQIDAADSGQSMACPMSAGGMHAGMN